LFTNDRTPPTDPSSDLQSLQKARSNGDFAPGDSVLVIDGRYHGHDGILHSSAQGWWTVIEAGGVTIKVRSSNLLLTKQAPKTLPPQPTLTTTNLNASSSSAAAPAPAPTTDHSLESSPKINLFHTDLLLSPDPLTVAGFKEVFQWSPQGPLPPPAPTTATETMAPAAKAYVSPYPYPHLHNSPVAKAYVSPSPYLHDSPVAKAEVVDLDFSSPPPLVPPPTHSAPPPMSFRSPSPTASTVTTSSSTASDLVHLHHSNARSDSFVEYAFDGAMNMTAKLIGDQLAGAAPRGN